MAAASASGPATRASAAPRSALASMMASPTEPPLTPLAAKTACRRHGVGPAGRASAWSTRLARTPPPAAATSTSGSTRTAPAGDGAGTAQDVVSGSASHWRRLLASVGVMSAWTGTAPADAATAGGRRMSCSVEAVSSTAPVSAMIRIRVMTGVLLSRSNVKTGSGLRV